MRCKQCFNTIQHPAHGSRKDQICGACRMNKERIGVIRTGKRKGMSMYGSRL